MSSVTSAAPPTASDYPFAAHFLDRQGVRYHYLDEGHGDTVVMVHGNPTWSYYYRHLVIALRDTHRCIVPDHIGCGRSDKPDDSRYEYTLKSRVDDLEALLEHRGIQDNITLVLHDWGGMIGMAYASRHPERIKRLVILNTAAFPLPATKRFPFALMLCRTPLVGAILVRGFNAFCRSAARVGCKRQPMPADVRAGYLAPYDSWANRIAVHRFVQDIPMKPSDAAYEIVREVGQGLERFRRVPMLICWGEQDFVFDRHFLDEWRRRFPEAEIHSFADAGHYILEDCRAEVVPLVCDFLKRHPLP
jgi:pimeloyl-ACP methyl ester carboxylesterase